MAKKDEKEKEQVVEETVEATEISDVAEAVEAVEEAPAVSAETETSSDAVEEPVFQTFAQEAPQAEVGGDKTVTVQPVKFASFEDLSQTHGEQNKNLDILMDIKLQLTVELGRTELPIKKVLELTRGSIIELEKVAGEPVELYANGKLVAHGEVVVIEDNFGLRITSITEPEDRLKGIGS